MYRTSWCGTIEGAKRRLRRKKHRLLTGPSSRVSRTRGFRSQSSMKRRKSPLGLKLPPLSNRCLNSPQQNQGVARKRLLVKGRKSSEKLSIASRSLNVSTSTMPTMQVVCARIAIIRKAASRKQNFVSIKTVSFTLVAYARRAICESTTIGHVMLKRKQTDSKRLGQVVVLATSRLWFQMQIRRHLL